MQPGIGYTGGSNRFNEMSGPSVNGPLPGGYQRQEPPSYSGPAQAGLTPEQIQFMMNFARNQGQPQQPPAQSPMGPGNASSIGFQAPNPGYNTNNRGMGAPVAPRPATPQGGGLLAQPGTNMRAAPVAGQMAVRQRGVY